MIKFYTSRLLDLVEKTSIGGVDYTSFFTEISLGVPSGSRLFIINGNYDSNNLLQEDRFLSGGDGYRVLLADNNRLTLSIPWTGRGISSDLSQGNPINIWVVNTITEFNYLDSILVDIYPQRCSKFEKGKTLNIIYTQNLVFSGQFFIRAFWAKNQGVWQMVSNSFDDGFNNYFDSIFDQESWNGKIKIRNGGFVYKGTEFIKGATYFWSNPRWIYDIVNTPCFISKLNFRGGYFDGDFYDGVFGQLDRKLIFSSNWYSGVAFNSEIKSSSVRTKSTLGENVSKAFLESNQINFFSDKSNNDGYGLSYFFDSTIESGEIYFGNFINCNFTCNLNPEVTDILQITTVGCLEYGTCCDTTTSTTTTTTSTTTLCECQPCVEGEKEALLTIWVNEGSLRLDYRLSPFGGSNTQLDFYIGHLWYLLDGGTFSVNTFFQVPPGGQTSDFTYNISQDLMGVLSGEEEIISVDVVGSSLPYKIQTLTRFKELRPPTTSTTTTSTTTRATTTTTSTTTRATTTTTTTTTTSTTTIPATTTSTTTTSTTTIPATTTSTTTLPVTTSTTTITTTTSTTTLSSGSVLIGDVSGCENQEVSVPIWKMFWGGINIVGLVISFDSEKLEFLGINWFYGGIIGFNQPNPGDLRITWEGNVPNIAFGQQLMGLRFRIKSTAFNSSNFQDISFASYPGGIASEITGPGFYIYPINFINGRIYKSC